MNINLCPPTGLLVDQMDINLCLPPELLVEEVDINLCHPDKLSLDLSVAQMDKKMGSSSKTLS